MAKTQFSMSTIKALDAPTKSGKQEVTWDPTTPGLGVLVSGVKASKMFIVQRKLGPKGKTVRVTIRATTGTTLDKAREEATAIYAQLSKGIDPKAPVPVAAAGKTLREALKFYLDNRIKLAPRTRTNYQGQI